MKAPQVLRRQRRLHRWVVPLAALPLSVTALSGSLYSLLLDRGIDAFWLLKIHTGQFGALNLQPYYAILLGLLTLVAIASGLLLLRQPPSARAPEDTREV